MKKNNVAEIDLGQVVPQPVTEEDILNIIKEDIDVPGLNALNSHGLYLYHRKTLPAVGRYIIGDENYNPIDEFPNTNWIQLKGMFIRSADIGEDIDPSILVSDGGLDQYEKSYGLNNVGEFWGTSAYWLQSFEGKELWFTNSMMGDTGWQSPNMEAATGGVFGVNSALQGAFVNGPEVRITRYEISQTHNNKPKYKGVKIWKRLPDDITEVK